MLRWRRVLALSAVLSALGAAGIGLSLWFIQPEKPKPPPPFETRLASDAEQREILEVLIESSEPRPDIPSPALMEEGLRFCAGIKPGISPPHTCHQPGSVQNNIKSPRFNLDMDAIPQIPADFRKALVRANLREHRMPRPHCDIAFISDSDSKPLADCHGRQYVFDNGEASFSGTVKATRAVVSTDGRQALLYSVYRFGSSAGFLHRFERFNGRWRLENTYGLWIS